MAMDVGRTLTHSLKSKEPTNSSDFEVCMRQIDRRHRTKMGKIRGTLTTHSLCDGAKANSSTGCTCALARAQDVQEKLSPRFASCVQLVNPSHRTYLALPRKFCHEHLPKFDKTFVFVGENEKKIRVDYSSGRFRFSVGWKRFYDAQSLRQRDALVFHLIDAERCKFKVYTVRSCRPKNVDGAVRNPNVVVSIDNEAARIGMTTVKEEHPDDLPEDRHQDNRTRRLNFHCDNLSSVVKFQQVNRFEDFKIHVDGQIVDSELPVHAKMKYYKLCRSRKMFLHDGLIEGLGSKLVAGMISKTSDIASAITSTRLGATPPFHDLELEHWDKALKGFEELGMSVGFLRARIAKLVKISRVCQTVDGSWRAKWAEVEEMDRALKEKASTMDALVESIETLKASKRSAESDMEAFEEEVQDLDIQFSSVADAPWTT